MNEFLKMLRVLLFFLLTLIMLQTCKVESGNSINDLIGRQIELSMNHSAKSCDNFYQYACGNWYQHYIDEMEYGDTLGMIDSLLNKKLEGIVHKPKTNVSEDSSEVDGGFESIYDKIHTYYRSCKKVKPYNYKRYLQLVQPGAGLNWFVIARSGARSWHREKFDWLQTISELRMYGLNGVFLSEEVKPRWDLRNAFSIYINRPSLKEVRHLDQGNMIESLLDIGLTKRDANDIARNVDRFQHKLSKLYEVEDIDSTKEMELGYLQLVVPEIDWTEYLKRVLGPTLQMNMTVIIDNIPYIKALTEMLDSTDRQTICNYIMLKFIQYLKEQGPAEINKEECIGSLRRVMPLAMSYIIGNHFYKHPERDDPIIQEVFENIKERFHDTLNENRLDLTIPTLKVLLDKIQNIRLQIGISPRNVSRTFYDYYYSSVELNTNFYYNQLSLLRLAVEKRHALLEYPIDPNLSEYGNFTLVLPSWQGKTSSPYFIRPLNLLVIPYGFLQMPIYHHNMLQVFKYSVLGFVISQELMHGFDIQGIEYDSDGTQMGPVESICGSMTFHQGLRCIQDNMSPGPFTLEGYIGDYEGLRLAYNTFFNGTLRKESTRFSIQLQYTEKQLFYLHLAQFFCGKVYHSVRQKSFLHHANNELRLLKALANLEEFSKDFSCDKNSKMQARSRCRIW